MEIWGERTKGASEASPPGGGVQEGDSGWSDGVSGEVGGRSPAAAGGESRRCLLCPGAAGAGCAPNPHPAGAL